MSYDFNKIEADWQKYWAENQTFQAENNSEKPTYYVLDMFPYPSGAGLHVGHPLGYIASDIVARFKRHQGFNVLHPMGYDSFGLPAEQYAIQTGQHPALTTKENIARYREQMDKIGFSFDWSREVRTSDPDYYKWTQWIFIQLFDSWYDKTQDKARPIADLIALFSSEGNAGVNAAHGTLLPSSKGDGIFSADEWNTFSEKTQQEILLKYRLTYLSETEVNWCPALGTVLANDEIVNGVSERGGHPIERKKMKQWSMRISAYAERLLQGLNNLDWSESLKETQRNWIGKSEGAIVKFPILSFPNPQLFQNEREPQSVEGIDNNNITRDFSDVNYSKHKEQEERKYGTLSSGEGRGEDEHFRYLTANSKISTTLLNRAKKMRANPTQAEAILWEKLKGKKLGIKFRRQHPIDNYIVDFVCLTQKLVIEVDGEIHQYQKESDDKRSLKLIEKLGYSIIRFSNDEVLKNIDGVLNKIKDNLHSSSHPQPFPKGRESQFGTEEEISTALDQAVPPSGARGIEVFTTRPDTIFGATFMTLAPEHDLVPKITTPEQKEAVEAYVKATAKRSERERMADVKTISGVFTGAYAEHPFTKEPIPIWIGDYVLAGYGTGAVMAVPCGDQRDYDFAKHFDLPIKNIFENVDISKEAHSGKEENTLLANSNFLNGLSIEKALRLAIEKLEETGQGKGKINYRLRDAVFSRQRYWGEPFPIYYKDGMPQTLPEECLPLRLPEVEKYLPTADGKPPLGNATKWHWDEKSQEVVSVANGKKPPSGVWGIELNTMPGWAGSSWYLFRYMEKAKRDQVFASKEALDYWQNVDLYIGGSEHGTGHLLYSRFWTKFLKDRNLVPVDEPFKKLINQGMILGESAFCDRITKIFVRKRKKDGDKFILSDEIEEVDLNDPILLSSDLDIYYNHKIGDKITLDKFSSSSQTIYAALGKNVDKKNQVYFNKKKYNITWISSRTPIPVQFVNPSNELDIKKFRKWRPEFNKAIFLTTPKCNFSVKREVEKMSKSKYNVVNPDDICKEYGADTLRLYEMFLGPLEQAKPWNTAGISGVHNFLKKLWKLYSSPDPSEGGGSSFVVSDEKASAESLKTLHKTIKKVTEDIENFSFNTSVSSFMICVNELSAQKCSSREVLEPLAVLISPYAPHISEELWHQLGHQESISTVEYPVFEAKYLTESTKTYPISFNGKMRFTMDLSLELSKEELEKTVMADERTQRQLDGRTPKKVIVVPGKIVNIVG